METWETVHEHEDGPGTVTIVWRWSNRRRDGTKLRAGIYRAKPVALQFSLDVPLEDQELLAGWLRER